MPAGWAKAELYIPNLAEQCVGLGCSASSYVIADLDQAYTKYYEATVESEYRGRKVVRAWLLYLQQVRTATSTRTTQRPEPRTTPTSSSARRTSPTAPDASCGTTRKARLHGDRPHALKAYGYYTLNWNATVGGFFTAQSGQVWEATSVQPYVQYTSSTSATNRYAEPAGSRRTSAWYLVDLNYIQNFPLKGRTSFQATVDLYNVFNSQTGYNYVSNLQSTLFNTPQSFLSPRRVQISARFQF